MRVVVVPVLADNYAYLLVDEASGSALAVDPAEAAKVCAAALEEGVRIVGVLTTHHHWDHAGGNSEMLQKLPGIKVYGGRLDNVQACTDPLEHNSELALGGIKIQALHTPGHTRGSISYYCTEGDATGVVFTGDTLFVGGCGRVIECTPADLYNSLVNVLGPLPEETQVYVGHEYTVKNLEFAAGVENENETLKQMLQWSKEQSMQRKFTVPSTMRNEFMINPFMRSGTAELRSMCPGCSPVEVFAELRRQKNSGTPSPSLLASLGTSKAQ
mmetsp:Transcript_109255/g.305678  ORF Transcript_109255/g.305678 Transcript_109255/m.305678 type:complete len:271 (+) Transcript_109255:112-924(+)